MHRTCQNIIRWTPYLATLYLVMDVPFTIMINTASGLLLILYITDTAVISPLWPVTVFSLFTITKNGVLLYTASCSSHSCQSFAPGNQIRYCPWTHRGVMSQTAVVPWPIPWLFCSPNWQCDFGFDQSCHLRKASTAKTSRSDQARVKILILRSRSSLQLEVCEWFLKWQKLTFLCLLMKLVSCYFRVCFEPLLPSLAEPAWRKAAVGRGFVSQVNCKNTIDDVFYPLRDGRDTARHSGTHSAVSQRLIRRSGARPLIGYSVDSRPKHNLTVAKFEMPEVMIISSQSKNVI